MLCRAAERGNVQGLLNLVALKHAEMTCVNFSTAMHKLARLAKENDRTLFAGDGRLALLHTRIRAVLEEQLSLGAKAEVLPRCWATISWACGTLQLRDPTVVKVLEAIGQLSLPHLDAFNPLELTNLLWGFAKLQVSCARLFELSCHFIASHLAFFSPSNLSTLVWAYVTAQQVRSGLIHQLVQEFVSRLNTAEVNPVELANLMWGLATAKLHPKGNMLSEVGNRALLIITQFKLQELSITAWAFSRLNARHDAFFAGVAQHLYRSHTLRQQIHSQGIANLLWSFERQKAMGSSSAPQLMVALGSLLPICVQLLPELKPQEFTCVFRALTKLGLTWGLFAEADELFTQAASVGGPLLRRLSLSQRIDLLEGFAGFLVGRSPVPEVCMAFVAALLHTCFEKVSELECLGSLRIVEVAAAAASILGEAGEARQHAVGMVAHFALQQPLEKLTSQGVSYLANMCKLPSEVDLATLRNALMQLARSPLGQRAPALGDAGGQAAHGAGLGSSPFDDHKQNVGYPQQLPYNEAGYTDDFRQGNDAWSALPAQQASSSRMGTASQQQPQPQIMVTYPPPYAGANQQAVSSANGFPQVSPFATQPPTAGPMMSAQQQFDWQVSPFMGQPPPAPQSAQQPQLMRQADLALLAARSLAVQALLDDGKDMGQGVPGQGGPYRMQPPYSSVEDAHAGRGNYYFEQGGGYPLDRPGPPGPSNYTRSNNFDTDQSGYGLDLLGPSQNAHLGRPAFDADQSGGSAAQDRPGAGHNLHRSAFGTDQSVWSVTSDRSVPNQNLHVGHTNFGPEQGGSAATDRLRASQGMRLGPNAFGTGESADMRVGRLSTDKTGSSFQSDHGNMAYLPQPDHYLPPEQFSNANLYMHVAEELGPPPLGGPQPAFGPAGGGVPRQQPVASVERAPYGGQNRFADGGEVPMECGGGPFGAQREDMKEPQQGRAQPPSFMGSSNYVVKNTFIEPEEDRGAAFAGRFRSEQPRRMQPPPGMEEPAGGGGPCSPDSLFQVTSKFAKPGEALGKLNAEQLLAALRCPDALEQPPRGASSGGPSAAGADAFAGSGASAARMPDYPGHGAYAKAAEAVEPEDSRVFASPFSSGLPTRGYIPNDEDDLSRLLAAASAGSPPLRTGLSREVPEMKEPEAADIDLVALLRSTNRKAMTAEFEGPAALPTQRLGQSKFMSDHLARASKAKAMDPEGDSAHASSALSVNQKRISLLREALDANGPGPRLGSMTFSSDHSHRKTMREAVRFGSDHAHIQEVLEGGPAAAAYGSDNGRASARKVSDSDRVASSVFGTEHSHMSTVQELEEPLARSSSQGEGSAAASGANAGYIVKNTFIEAADEDAAAGSQSFAWQFRSERPRRGSGEGAALGPLASAAAGPRPCGSLAAAASQEWLSDSLLADLRAQAKLQTERDSGSVPALESRQSPDMRPSASAEAAALLEGDLGDMVQARLPLSQMDPFVMGNAFVESAEALSQEMDEPAYIMRRTCVDGVDGAGVQVQ